MRRLLSNFSVTNVLDSGPGSLRQAILSADAASGTSYVSFDISGTSRTIVPLSPLPAITATLVIDGTTQPGYAGSPLIELDGSQAGTSANGLYFQAAGAVRGLVINRFAVDGVRIYANDVTVAGDYIGTDTSGTVALGNGGSGVNTPGFGNTIGGTALADRNVISGNLGSGILITNTRSPGDGNTVIGNYIGTDATGESALGNGFAGVFLWESHSNTIGGSALADRNVISGNGGEGLNIYQSVSTVVQNNLIGTDATGTKAVANLNNGVGLAGNSTGVTLAGNVISGNVDSGVFFTGTGVTQNTVLNNIIGADSSGESAIGNQLIGIGLWSGASQNTVSGNLVSSNGDDGVQLNGVGTEGNIVQGNKVGTDLSGTLGLGNVLNGVRIDGGASDNTVGGTVAGEGNLISGNHSNGVYLTDAGSDGNIVAGNLVGTDRTGSSAVANWGAGVSIALGASDNLIGGNDPGARNVVSGNGDNGVLISDLGTANNLVVGNYLGTDAAGTQALGNTWSGVAIEGGATNNTVGGTSAAERNVLSGNNWNGADIGGAGTTGNVVQGNYVGVDPSGTLPVANVMGGIAISGGAQNNTLGGSAAGAGNVVSANGREGIVLANAGTSGNFVEGNLVGTDWTGTRPLGNTFNGVLVYGGASGNTIGGAELGDGNVIAGNGADGVSLTDPGTNFNTVSGNFIGTDTTATLALGNGEDGISVANGAQSNTIGGSTSLANTILFNAESGVGIYDNTTTGNTIRFNSIRANGELGIDLGGNGVTPNHGNSAAVGPNNLQNYPVITSAASGATTTVGISFVSLPNGSYTIDFYASPNQDPSGYGEGSRYLGSVSVTTSATGQVNLPATFNLPASTSPGQWITATATDLDGDTSEFSAAWLLPTISSQETVTSSISSPTYGQSLTFSASVVPYGSGLPTPTGTVQFLADGSPFGSPVMLDNGEATSISTRTLPSGIHTISAVYSGDSTYSTNTETVSRTVISAPLTIIANNASKVYGAADPILSYTAMGLVNGDTQSVISGVTLATATGAAATAGTHVITVSGGTAANYAITDVNGTLSVSQATPTVNWSNPADITYGTPLSATQLDPIASIQGNFVYSPALGTVLGGGSTQTLSATFKPQDSTDYTTASVATTITVERAVPTLKLSDPGGAYDGSPFPASVMITGSGPDNTPATSLGGVTPTLTYYNGSNTAETSLGATPPTAVGTYTAVASFSGDTNYSAVKSAPVTFKITPAAAAIALTSSTDLAVYRQPITFVAAVAAASTPTGTVTFLDNGTILATVALNGSGVATLTTTALALGSHSVTANYSGDAGLVGAQSGSSPESIGQSGTSVAFGLRPVLKKKKVVSEVLTVVIEPTSPGGGVPTGMIRFEILTKKKNKNVTKTLGIASLSGGAATLTVNAKSIVGETITLVYGGDADFRASTATSPKLTQNALKSQARSLATLASPGRLRTHAAKAL